MTHFSAWLIANLFPPTPLFPPVPPANQPSSPCVVSILTALQSATCKADVRALFQRHDVDDINAAWRQLSSVERSALNLCRIFDGTIISDYSEGHS